MPITCLSQSRQSECLQTLPNVPWGPKSFPVENHWLIPKPKVLSGQTEPVRWPSNPRSLCQTSLIGQRVWGCSTQCCSWQLLIGTHPGCPSLRGINKGVRLKVDFYLHTPYLQTHQASPLLTVSLGQDFKMPESFNWVFWSESSIVPSFTLFYRSQAPFYERGCAQSIFIRLQSLLGALRSNIIQCLLHLLNT